MARSSSKDKRLPTPIEAEIFEQPITETIETNYMPYVMSVIISRAIPSIDGFKPAHRKLLYTMFKMGLLGGQRTKSANVVGQTMKLNPHGDVAIYETMVRLTRGNESLLHPFVDSKGSFGKQYSRDMAYAASRYTEVRLDAFAAELFDGIDRDAVDMVPNYDNTLVEPVLLPTSFPNILISPNLGIAVGMACSICSFNLGEICDGTIALLRNANTSVEKMMSIIKAPDFPGGGQIVYEKEVMESIFTTGTGSLRVRARYRYDKDQNAIDILQIPYSTSIEAIMKKLTDLIKEGKIRAITDVRDAIDLSGFKLTIDLRRDTDPDKLMAKLYKLTPLEDTFDCNFNILVHDTPMQLGVMDILREWISFRMECVRRDLSFTLEKKQDKLHLLLGLASLLLDIDKAIRIIRNTEKEADVVPHLMDAFHLSEKQADYIAEIRLRHLNREYILNRISEIENLQKEIAEIDATIKDDLKIKSLIAKQLHEIKKKYGKPRKTLLINAEEIEEIDPEDLIDSFPVQVVLSREGYMKKMNKQSLRSSDEMRVKEGDTVVYNETVDNSAQMIVFTDHHHAYKIKLSDLEIAKPSALGDYLPALCGMAEDERIEAAAAIESKQTDGRLVMIYTNGKGVRIPISAFETQTKRPKIPHASYAKSHLISVFAEESGQKVLIKTDAGKGVVIPVSLFPEESEKAAEGGQIVTLKARASVVSASFDELSWPDLPDKAYKEEIPALPVPLPSEGEEET